MIAISPKEATFAGMIFHHGQNGVTYRHFVVAKALVTVHVEHRAEILHYDVAVRHLNTVELDVRYLALAAKLQGVYIFVGDIVSHQP